MRQGQKLCYDIDKTKPDFGGNLRLEGTFDPDLFFNYEYMTVEDNYLPFIRDSENHGMQG